MAAVEPVFALGAYLEAERAAIEAARTRVVEELLSGVAPPVCDAIRYALDAGGKRLRPVLCVAAYRAAAGGRDMRPGAAPDGVYAIACGLELIHTYSLVHDDLPCMDDDDLRRGRPTTHRVFGERAAVAAGAAMIPLAARAVERGGRALGLPAGTCMRLVRELLAAAGGGGMVGGQLLDIEAERRAIPVAALEAIHHRKTGALLAAAPRMGGIAARASERIVDGLGAYGRRLGLAFQIADDVLDVTGSAAALGKAAGRDAVLAKATYPALLGVDGARRRAREEAEAAVAALRAVEIDSPVLEALAYYAVERDR
ncbi:MAG TPA: farnesyl diphosphate synthase [Longimicrobiales bacterium]